MQKEKRKAFNRVVKRISKAIIAILLIFALLLGAFIIYVNYQLKWKKTAIAVYDNTTTGYTVLFEQIGVPFLFGTHNVKITLKNERGKEIDHIDATIANDGATLYESNVVVVWEDNMVKVILKGCEQKDETYEFYYKSP